MNWRDYEHITKYIYEALGQARGVRIEGYGSSCKIKGKSGVDHQIDVLTSHTDGIHSYKTAIECKFWEDRISKDIVMKVAEIVEDTGVNKGVIVSKKGFTEDGVSFARYKNIGLVELREAQEGDEKVLDIATINITGEIRRPEILTITINNVLQNINSEKFNAHRMKIKFKAAKELTLENYLALFRTELHGVEPYRVIEKCFDLEVAVLIDEMAKQTTDISQIKLTGRLTTKVINVNRRIVDEVWLIMKSLFEKKSFIISRSGSINETQHE